MNVKRLLLAGSLVLGPWAVPAGAVDVELYEVSGTITRTSSSRTDVITYTGRAGVGTPICPESLVARVKPGATSCAVIVSGPETLGRAAGTGTIGGPFKLVVGLDARLDGLELVLFEGELSGSATLSPSLLDGLPYGTLTGTVTDADRVRHPVAGVFRRPFPGSDTPFGPSGKTNRQIYCPRTPTSPGGNDLVWLDTTGGLPNGSCIDVAPGELALGTPAMRLDVLFGRDTPGRGGSSDWKDRDDRDRDRGWGGRR